MNSWSLDWLKQRAGWQEELEAMGQQRRLGSHLVHLFRQAISTNILLPGDRLPAVRDLVNELGIARNTAVYVYEQLCAEGYAYSRTGSGTFVAMVTPAMVHKALVIKNSERLSQRKAIGSTTEFSARVEEILASASVDEKQWGAFMPGVPDVTQFPRAAYARIINRLWRHARPEMLTYDTNGGAPQLKAALANYLRVGRGVQCEPAQIIITEGTHQALDLIIRTLVNPGEVVWTEEPGYPGISNLLKMNPGIKILQQPVDADGMIFDDEKLVPKLIFTTPSHQYPLGVVMSLERREKILNYAQANRCWIVEDDYDSEFRFGGRQTPSIQGMVRDAPVIYLGTFSKTLFPGLRIGYMILPHEILSAMQRIRSEIYRGGNLITHMALGEFIDQGHYTKHIRKMRVVYSKRRDWLKKLIAKYLGENYLAEVDSHAGLHLVLYFVNPVDDVQVCTQLFEEGILAKPLSKYYAGKVARRGLLLGYAAVEESDMQEYFFRMLHILKKNLV